uniref:Uncharacterized protein n=1 Tax=Hyaloperonospora arabidopsidis (strain Emoy2) TaxID=559515 RepID=M4B589_HYAAE
MVGCLERKRFDKFGYVKASLLRCFLKTACIASCTTHVRGVHTCPVCKLCNSFNPNRIDSSRRRQVELGASMAGDLA